MKAIQKLISKRSMLLTLTVVGILPLAVFLISCSRGPAAKAPRSGSTGKERGTGDGGGEDIVRVKTITPKRDPSLQMTVEEPAYVEPYYRANLEARVAGPVKYIEKDIGTDVKKGDTLIVIAVPDYEKEVDMKKAVIEQRKADLKVAEASVKIATASMQAAEKDVRVAQAEVTAAAEELEYRRLQHDRYEKLASERPPVVTRDVADEYLKYWNVAKARKIAAEAGVLKSQALLEEATEKQLGAQADVDLKKSLIRVAEADREQAKARLELATIKADWDGRIVARNVDPGTFVHSAATTDHSKALMTVERTDLVTVYMKVPEAYASNVNKDTEAVIEMDDLPGSVIRAKVSRKSGTLQNAENDRTMRVEVDLYNLPEKTWNAWKSREETAEFQDLKERSLPQLPTVNGEEGVIPGQRLMPGMYGKMTLVLRNEGNVYLLPSDAIVRQGGMPYVYIVKDGVVHRFEVAVKLDDGKVAHVQLLTRKGSKTIREELTGKETVVISNQGELAESQAVEDCEVDW
jgi:multidrug resistance efflux pump